MKNILFIGPYKQNDGWSETARVTIKALNTTKHNLTIRPIYMANSIKQDLDVDFIRLEQQQYDHYDIVIQNVLPHLLDYNVKLGKNISLFDLETLNLQHLSWPSYINTMDETWITSHIEKVALEQSGVDIPIQAVGQSVDLEKFNKKYESLFQDNSFKFYFIGEFIQRKGIHELLIAYLSEFAKNENVNLILKTKTTKQDIDNFIKQTKDGLGMYKNHDMYPELKLIIDFIDDNTLNKLHASCDCFVMPSYGESWCIPAIEAMGFGNTPIVTDNTGMVDFINETNGWIINSHETVVTTVQRPLQDLYTGHETWYQPNILRLRQCMREAFNSYPIHTKKSNQGKKDIEKYSHENIGKIYESLL